MPQPMRELVFPQQTPAHGQVWGPRVFVLAESRRACDVPSQPWVLLQTVEVEQSELVLSKEKQRFPQTSSLPQIQRPAGSSA